MNNNYLLPPPPVGIQQQYLTQQQQYSGPYWGINSLGGLVPPPILNLLDIDTKEKEINKKIAEYNKYKAEEEIINSLHDVTKELLRIAYEISISGKLEDVVKLDKYVREQLFNKEFNKIINE